MTNLITSDNKRLIIGMGATGLSCARFFASEGLSFDMCDTRAELPNQEAILKEFPASQLVLGALQSDYLAQYSELIVSPGIAIATDAIQRAHAAGSRIRGDVDVFAECVNRANQDDAAYKPVIAITGSNGKSTVTTLVGGILTSLGKNPAICGNIGLPVLDTLRDTETNKAADYDCYVIELSSFQLETTHHLAADAACVLNISEDHMDRYANMMAYHQAKHRIFQGCRSVVTNRDDSLTQPLVSDQMPSLSFGLEMPSDDVGRKGKFGLDIVDGIEYLSFEQQAILPVAELSIKGRHNAMNALAAMALLKSVSTHGFELDLAEMGKALKAFAGLPHRCAWVAEINDINYFNDSKGTNVGSTLAAIEGLANVNGHGDAGDKKIILLAGGVGKDQDFSPLRDACQEYVKKTLLFGRDAKMIATALGKNNDQAMADNLEQVLQEAVDIAEPGDVILFSPACASFDQFDNYVKRGDYFEALVARMVESAQSSEERPPC